MDYLSHQLDQNLVQQLQLRLAQKLYECCMRRAFSEVKLAFYSKKYFCNSNFLPVYSPKDYGELMTPLWPATRASSNAFSEKPTASAYYSAVYKLYDDVQRWRQIDQQFWRKLQLYSRHWLR